jgi:threonine aldolase
VSLEDTANRGGGAVYDFEEIKRIRQFCIEHKLPLHLDGARLMNALVRTGINPKEYASQFDSISLCLSKGLGAPVGSVLIGSSDFIKKARRVRKVFGGGMRQAGIIAAGGLYALKHNVERLKIDHDNASVLEETLNQLSWVKEVMPVQTNIVVAILNDASQRDVVIEKLANEQIRIMAFGPGMIRMVTHLDNSSEDIQRVSEVLKNLEV